MVMKQDEASEYFDNLEITGKKYRFFKNIYDPLLAILVILILSPVFLAISLAIKVYDPTGPVLFKQERIGLNGKNFYMYKFRSMYIDAEDRLEELLHLNEVEGAMFKIKEDPRITKIGKLLRKTSMDELPQLINVVRGDMSLIGPRPPLTREYEMYNNYEKERLSIKPGMTGLWQVSGRNDLSFNQMIELDREYITTISFSRDASIFLRTFFVIFKNDNAY